MFDILNKKKTIKEFLMYNKPYPYLKNHYNSVIPLDIYQTWFTKDLPPKMRERVELLKIQNPRFNHHLFDDNDCREFIKTHFQPDVLEAYDTLIPGAYKADLWRLCVLFINGGIYVDIKFCCVNGFKLIELTETEHLAKDRPPNSIYNSLKNVIETNFPHYAIYICKELGNDITPTLFMYNDIRKSHEFFHIIKLHTKSNIAQFSQLTDFLLDKRISDLMPLKKKKL